MANPKSERSKDKTRVETKTKVKDSSKACELCQQQVDLRYRIQHDATEKWVLVCSPCWHRVQPNNPYYRYGGTWKANRRSRQKGKKRYK
ncbi:MAG: hypothetical protein AAFN12_08645 [Cyanobacteria bacterium J06560_2]